MHMEQLKLITESLPGSRNGVSSHGVQPGSSHDGPSHPRDQELVDWLKQIGCDQETVDRFIEEQYSKHDVLEVITKDDLRRMHLRGGIHCRIWHAIMQHRMSFQHHHPQSPPGNSSPVITRHSFR